MGEYDHKVHAGNAGDIWKHFLLLEAADFLLEQSGKLVYAESHVGRPHYTLEAPGEWEWGIGRIWPHISSLKSFSCFRIISELNPGLGQSSIGLLYPGSARQIQELARRRGADLRAEIWDNHPDVAASWQAFLQEDLARSARLAQFQFLLGDGFSGLLSMLRRTASESSASGLLFIDPPYIKPQDALLAQELLQEARDKGWIVLWWYMKDMITAPQNLDILELDFYQAGMDGRRWKGAGVAVAGDEGRMHSRLIRHLRRRADEFIRIVKYNFL